MLGAIPVGSASLIRTATMTDGALFDSRLAEINRCLGELCACYAEEHPIPKGDTVIAPRTIFSRISTDRRT